LPYRVDRTCRQVPAVLQRSKKINSAVQAVPFYYSVFTLSCGMLPCCTMKRLWLLLAATLGMVSSAAACSCAPPPPGTRTAWALQQWYLQRTPVVFQGKADKIVLENFPFKPVPGKSISDIPQLRVSFSEVKFYRGESPGS